MLFLLFEHSFFKFLIFLFSKFFEISHTSFICSLQKWKLRENGIFYSSLTIRIHTVIIILSVTYTKSYNKIEEKVEPKTESIAIN